MNRYRGYLNDHSIYFYREYDDFVFSMTVHPDVSSNAGFTSSTTSSCLDEIHPALSGERVFYLEYSEFVISMTTHPAASGRHAWSVETRAGSTRRVRSTFSSAVVLRDRPDNSSLTDHINTLEGVEWVTVAE